MFYCMKKQECENEMKRVILGYQDVLNKVLFEPT